MTETKPIKKITKKTIKQVSTQNKTNFIDLATTTPELVKHNLSVINEISSTIKDSLIDGMDYGQIPDTDKPTLFKAGADKLCFLFGLRQEAELISREFTNERKIIITYTFKVKLLDFKNRVIAMGMGLCSSAEKSKETQNPLHIENTLLKMAKKRALVDAVVSLGTLSKVFTQDIEDMPLATSNIDNQKIKSFDALKLFSLTYDNFASVELLFNLGTPKENKKDYQELVKLYIKTIWLKKMGFVKSSFFDFTKPDRKKFLEYINQIENKENDNYGLTKFKEEHYKYSPREPKESPKPKPKAKKRVKA